MLLASAAPGSPQAGAGPGEWPRAGQQCLTGRAVSSRKAIRGALPAGYDGWVSFDYEAEGPEATGIPRALAYLKRMLAG